MDQSDSHVRRLIEETRSAISATKARLTAAEAAHPVDLLLVGDLIDVLSTQKALLERFESKTHYV